MARSIYFYQSNKTLSNTVIAMDTAWVILTGLSSFFSIIGCGIIIFTFVWIKQLRTVCRKLLVYLSVSDMLTAIGNILGITWYLSRDDSLARNVFYCHFHSALTIFSSISSYLWTVSIAVYLYASIVCNNGKLANKFVPIFHLICWIIPAVISTTAWSLGVLGYDKTLEKASWCWINHFVPNAVEWQFITGEAWKIAAYVGLCVLYTLIKVHLCKHTRSLQNSNSPQNRTRTGQVIEDANRKMTFVPAVFIVLRIWGTIRFFIGAYAHKYAESESSLWIVPLQGIGDSAQGFANCILFCYVENIRAKVRRKCCKVETRRKPPSTFYKMDDHGAHNSKSRK